MTYDSRTTVAFTGHRTYDGAGEAALQAAVESLYERGFRTFMCGMAVGFDLAAAEAVVASRASFTELRLVCIIPFLGQEARFSADDRGRFDRLLVAADRTIVLSSVYHPGCYAVRNNYLTDHASVLVAWYDGAPGGTHYTVRRALRRGLEVVSLCPACPHLPAPDPELF